MREKYYRVRFDIKCNKQQHPWVGYVLAHNRKEAVQTARECWGEKPHMFHIDVHPSAVQTPEWNDNVNEYKRASFMRIGGQQ